MGQVWFTSDLHLHHDQAFIYEPRGFKSVYEMNVAIAQNWNAVVQPEEDVYVLGDLMLNDNDAAMRIIKQLKGQIHVVRGNHDTDARMELYNQCYNIVEITEGQFFKWNGYHFYLSHYPCLCSNFDDNKPLKNRLISLAGHSHYKDKFQDMDKGLIYHVEVDAHNCYPISIEDIVKDIQEEIKML